MSHPVFHQGDLPVGPSPIAGGPATERYDGVHLFTQPRALRATELAGVTRQFRAAAERALAAGFDGVEVHAGNGYLLDQFLRDGANHRDDDYGGTARNRARLLREVTAAVISIWGSKRVGVRISPLSPTNGMTDSDPVATFTQAARDLQTLGVGYLHVIEPGVNGRSTIFQRLPSVDQLSLNVVAHTSECSPSGPPSLSSTLMSSPAVGEAGLLG